MKINVLFEEENTARPLIEKVMETCAELEHLSFEAEVGMFFVSDEEIQTINSEQRGIDRPTDVLSFPMLNMKPGEVYTVLPEDLNPETGRVYLGDVVISLERAEAQAQEYGHTIEREIAFLSVHSFLHLLGYDHIEEEERRIMRLHEEAVLTALLLTREE